ncbi:MAG: Hsp20/alpha crystallin family protein [Deltaproteobacteria bacterium]|nr:Hsp20/alpha crystallin family protein [Deltaproteobacteria bacterium]MCW5808223.1 Hsp20/alpha crystallin family protein [Deltaproteobacteria bacterium]
METTKESGGLIRGLRDRLQRRSQRTTTHRRRDATTDLVRRGDYAFELDPFRMMREMMRLDPFRLLGSDQADWMPSFEVRENGAAIRVIADVPGVGRDDIDITISGNRLIVAGEREAQERSRDENVHAWERRFGRFVRTFVLPDNVDGEHITSELRDGVLTVVLPLKQGSAAPRKIAVGGAAPRA